VPLRFAFASVSVLSVRGWLSSSETLRIRPSMIDQNLEHFMGSLAQIFHRASLA